MLLKRKLKYKDLDFINNGPSQKMEKPKPSEKIQALLDVINPKTIEKVKPSFVRPTTPEGWTDFHKMNEEGMKKAYESPEGYFHDGNKMYIAGTRDLGDVRDWLKLPLGTFKDSKIYKNADDIINEDESINYIVGHSAGGSAALEFEKNYPERKITSVTYAAPVFSDQGNWASPGADPRNFFGRDKSNDPLRFYHLGDIVASLDPEATMIPHAPTFNLDLVKDVTKLYSEPSFDNLKSVGKSITNPANFDPLGMHTMGDSYSKPSTPMDFVKSIVQGVGIAKTAGIL